MIRKAKKIAGALLAGAVCFALAGCTGADTQEAEDLVRTAYLTEEDMAQADMWASCDDTALAAVMKKAEAGENVTVVYIGGSITQGTIAAGTKDGEVAEKKCYADIVSQWWEERFPDTEFRFVNAGIGGTDSYLGVHRLKDDVLSYDPDLVLVEFSVNDGDSQFYKRSYDNLVRNLLTSENQPAVMLLFMAQSNGTSAQNSHVYIGYDYQLPMVSYGNVIKTMIADGRYTEEDLSGDGTHPSALGHAITGEIIWNYLNNVYASRNSYGEVETFDTKPTTKSCYENADILDNQDIEPDTAVSFADGTTVCAQYPDGWMTTEGESEITFTAEFRNLGLLYYKTTDGKSGQFEVYIDGEYAGKIDADFTGGWGNAIEGSEIYTSDAAAEHVVTVKKMDGSTGDVLYLLGLLVS